MDCGEVKAPGKCRQVYLLGTKTLAGLGSLFLAIVNGRLPAGSDRETSTSTQKTSKRLQRLVRNCSGGLWNCDGHTRSATSIGCRWVHFDLFNPVTVAVPTGIPWRLGPATNLGRRKKENGERSERPTQPTDFERYPHSIFDCGVVSCPSIDPLKSRCGAVF